MLIPSKAFIVSKPKVIRKVIKLRKPASQNPNGFTTASRAFQKLWRIWSILCYSCQKGCDESRSSHFQGQSLPFLGSSIVLDSSLLSSQPSWLFSTGTHIEY